MICIYEGKWVRVRIVIEPKLSLMWQQANMVNNKLIAKQSKEMKLRQGKSPSDSQPNPLQAGAARSDVMSAEAVALCMGIRDSRHMLLISTGDLHTERKTEQ